MEQQLFNPSFDSMWDGETAFPVAFLYDSRIPAESVSPGNVFKEWHTSLICLLQEVQQALRT